MLVVNACRQRERNLIGMLMIDKNLHLCAARSRRCARWGEWVFELTGHGAILAAGGPVRQGVSFGVYLFWTARATVLNMQPCCPIETIALP